MTESSLHKVLLATQKKSASFSLKSLANKLKKIGKSSDIGEKYFTTSNPKIRVNFYIGKREVFKTRKHFFARVFLYFHSVLMFC